MVILWKSHGILMDFSWKPHGNRLETSWKLPGNLMKTSWKPHGNLMEMSWKSNGNGNGNLVSWHFLRAFLTLSRPIETSSTLSISIASQSCNFMLVKLQFFQSAIFFISFYNIEKLFLKRWCKFGKLYLERWCKIRILFWKLEYNQYCTPDEHEHTEYH